METLKLEHIQKIYKGTKKKEGDVVAVNDFNLSIENNEFIVFVGPSGCGKSTTLRMIAGLEEISAGNLYLDGEIVNKTEAQYRNIAMVFQNYALYPHMTAYQNMAFGLKNRKVPKEEIDKRIKEAAAILNIEQLLNRKPKAMSGGERQRVALGRAIVRTPKIFLLDEPLSNLDAKLRASMRVEISRLYEKLKTTFIYVTHDQVEAMTMGTRIVVMKKGVMQQVDTPTNLFDYPKNRFVAGFLGTPQMNFYETTLQRVGDKLKIQLYGNELVYKLNDLRQINNEYLDGEVHNVIFGVRPDDIKLGGKIKAKVTIKEVLGNETLVYANLDLEDELTVKDSPTSIVIKNPVRVESKFGDIITLDIEPKNVHLFSVEEGEPSIMLTPRSKQNELKGYLKVVNNKVHYYLDANNGFILDEINPEKLNPIYLENMHRVRINLNNSVKVHKDGVLATYVGSGYLNGELVSTFDLANKDYKTSFVNSESHVYVKNVKKTFDIGEQVKLSFDVADMEFIGDDNISIFDMNEKEKPLDIYDLVNQGENIQKKPSKK